MSNAVEGRIADEPVEEQAETTTEAGAILGRTHAPEDPTPAQQMRLMESSSAISFWNDPEEDAYSPGDGD